MPSPPGSGDPPQSDGKLFLIACGTAVYSRLTLDAQLPTVKDDLRRIVGLFEGRLGYEQVLPGLVDDPSSPYLQERLSGWMKAMDRTESDRVVLYFSGHGVVEAGEHYLLTRESDPNNLAGTAFLTSNLARMLVGTRLQQLMVILDTCHAAAGSQDFAQVAQRYTWSLRPRDDISCGFYALAAARPKEEALQGVFSEALVKVLEDPPAACGDDVQEYLSAYEHLVEAINAELKKRNLQQRARVDAFGVQTSARFFRNLRSIAAIQASTDVPQPPNHQKLPVQLVLDMGRAIHYVSTTKGEPLEPSPRNSPPQEALITPTAVAGSILNQDKAGASQLASFWRSTFYLLVSAVVSLVLTIGITYESKRLIDNFYTTISLLDSEKGSVYFVVLVFSLLYSVSAFIHFRIGLYKGKPMLHLHLIHLILGLTFSSLIALLSFCFFHLTHTISVIDDVTINLPTYSYFFAVLSCSFAVILPLAFSRVPSRKSHIIRLSGGCVIGSLIATRAAMILIFWTTLLDIDAIHALAVGFILAVLLAPISGLLLLHYRRQ